MGTHIKGKRLSRAFLVVSAGGRKYISRPCLALLPPGERGKGKSDEKEKTKRRDEKHESKKRSDILSLFLP
jgi:hypothetical protein